MKMFGHRRNKVLDDETGRRDGIDLEEETFVAMAGLTTLAPTMLLCLVVGQLWPLLLVVGSDTLGAMVGVVKFKSSSDNLRPTLS